MYIYQVSLYLYSIVACPTIYYIARMCCNFIIATFSIVPKTMLAVDFWHISQVNLIVTGSSHGQIQPAIILVFCVAARNNVPHQAIKFIRRIITRIIHTMGSDYKSSICFIHAAVCIEVIFQPDGSQCFSTAGRRN